MSRQLCIHPTLPAILSCCLPTIYSRAYKQLPCVHNSVAILADVYYYNFCLVDTGFSHAWRPWRTTKIIFKTAKVYLHNFHWPYGALAVLQVNKHLLQTLNLCLFML